MAVLPAPPIFVVGPGRSGTTLMRSLLSAHPEVAVTPETHFMHIASEAGWLPGRRNGRAVWRAYHDHVRFLELGLDRGEVEARITDPDDVRDVFTAVLSAYLERAGKKRIGEKTPGHWHHLPTLLRWFPGARVVVMRRDPRASGASQLKTPWVRNRLMPVSWRSGVFLAKRTQRIAGDARAWTRLHGMIERDWQEDARILSVSFEALTADPEGVLRPLCALVGLDFDRRMIDGRTSEAVRAPADVAGHAAWQGWQTAHHAKTREPITTGPERWRHEMSEREVAIVEGFCAPMMDRFGYDVTATPAARRRARASAEFHLHAARFEKRLRVALRRRPFAALV